MFIYRLVIECFSLNIELIEKYESIGLKLKNMRRNKNNRNRISRTKKHTKELASFRCSSKLLIVL